MKEKHRDRGKILANIRKSSTKYRVYDQSVREVETGLVAEISKKTMIKSNKLSRVKKSRAVGVNLITPCRKNTVSENIGQYS